MRCHHPTKGLSLVEVIIWVALFGIIMFTVVTSILYFYRVNSYTLQEASAVVSAQRSIDNMVRTIREASYSSEGAFPIVAINWYDFIFYADVDSDPLIEKVHYSVDGTRLLMGITQPTGDPPNYSGPTATSTLADYVHNRTQNISAFQFFDEDGDEILDVADWPDVRFVKVRVVVNIDPQRLPNQSILNSSAAIRNIIGN